MSELIKPPSRWAFRLSLKADELFPALNNSNQRLISIKSFLDGSNRVYSGVSVHDEGLGGSWHARKRPSSLNTTLGRRFRLTALDCFEERGSTFCAAAWVENSDNIRWGWDFDRTAAEVEELLKKNDAKPITIRTYKTTMGGSLVSPRRRYCVIWQEKDVEWGWMADAILDSIEDTLEAQSGRLISIDNLDNQVWLGEQEHYCAVWYKNETGQPWFINIGLNKSKLPREPPKFCSWPLDVSHCTSSQYVSLLEQYPKPADPDLANLITVTGDGAATFRETTFMDIQFRLNALNLVSEQVDMESAFLFGATEGGWSTGATNFTNPSGNSVLGVPLTLAASQNYSANSIWAVSNNPKLWLFLIKAVGATGKHQFLLSQAPIRHAGSETPAELPIQWPMFLGIQSPVEAVELTNGKRWVTVAGQVINGTGKPLDVAHVSLKLKDQNNVTVYRGTYTDKLTIDQDVLGQRVDPAITGPVSNSDAPLPKFYDGFEVPADFISGKLKLQAHVKFRSGRFDCFSDLREIEVRRAPITEVERLPYDVPVINGVADPNFRWGWGNGVGGTTLNAHSMPEHRYSYDLGVIDPNGQAFEDPNKLDQNENFYCWGQPVFAMSPGRVIHVTNDFEDHFGRTQNTNSTGANVVVILDAANIFQVYVHFQRHTVRVAVGDAVNAGDELGLVGNSGMSTEPHLHFGILRQDSQGFLRSLPITFRRIRDSSNNLVTGVPVDNESYTAN